MAPPYRQAGLALQALRRGRKVGRATVYFWDMRVSFAHMATADPLLKPTDGAAAGTPSSPTSTTCCASRSDSFVVKELAPHAEGSEETTFPDSVFRRMGELGFLGSRTRRSTAARAATTSATSCWPRNCDALGGSRWAWPSTPTWRRPPFLFGTEGRSIGRVPRSRREDLLYRHQRAGTPGATCQASDPRGARRRRVGRRRVPRPTSRTATGPTSSCC